MFESWYKTRRSVWWTMSPAAPEKGMTLLYDRNFEDVYGDPGAPLSRRTEWGTYVLAKLDAQRKFLMQVSHCCSAGAWYYKNTVCIVSHCMPHLHCTIISLCYTFTSPHSLHAKEYIAAMMITVCRYTHRVLAPARRAIVPSWISWT